MSHNLIWQRRTYLAAVLSSPATSAFCELPCVFFPFTALIVGALAYASSSIVLSAQIPHDHAGPILHVLGVVSYGEFLHQGEDVVIIRLEEFFVFIFGWLRQHWASAHWAVYLLDLSVNSESWDQVGFLEVVAKVTVF
jgi:hypothetical protein